MKIEISSKLQPVIQYMCDLNEKYWKYDREIIKIDLMELQALLRAQSTDKIVNRR